MQPIEEVSERVRRGDRPGALALATQYLAQNQRHPLILILAAEQLEDLGRYREAIPLLQEALQEADGEPEIWRRYGVALGRQGLLQESRDALEEAYDIAPEQAGIRIALATACYRLGDLDTAEDHYRALAEASPEWVEPQAGMAVILAQRGDDAGAGRYARRVLARDPANPVARVAQARAALVTGDAQRAEQLADGLLRQFDQRSDHRLALLGLRADARDALGRYEEAFSDYSSRNALLMRQYEPVVASFGYERPTAEAHRLKQWFDDPAHWWSADADATVAAAPCAGHLFVVGFPRSGTTLLEKALAGHSAIRTLPEIDILGATAGDLLADAPGLTRLAASSADECAALRRRYFEAVTGEVGDISGRVIVDKLPLHARALPLIVRLFPEARIVLSLRDPRDVVLSGFRRRFQMNVAMVELLVLDSAAAFYDAVMTLLERYRTALPVAPHPVRHEDLVTDFEGQVHGVLDLVGLEWEDAVRDFAARAGDNARTPSDYQLRRGLNRDGVGTWRHYAPHLDAVRPVLDRWAAHWGYPAD